MDFEQTLQKLKDENKLVRDLFNLAEKYKRYFPFAAFVVGFGWDTLTLSRIDRWIDNARLLLYLVLLCLMIVISNFIDRDRIKDKRFVRFKEFYPVGIHFFLGSLFSAYVVFYFQSASLSKNILFVFILVFFLVAIEFLTDRLKNLTLQLALLFIVVFAFFTFFVPVVSKSMSIYSFLASGIISLFILGIILFLFYKKGIFVSISQIYLNCALILSIFLFVNLLYFFNLIPPVPLSLKQGGVYHGVAKKGDLYQLSYEKPPWYVFWRTEDSPFHFASDDTIVGFTAIFAPSELEQTIFHHWQRYVDKKQKWVTYDKVSFEIEGGREGGFRGYSRKQFIANGEWRIEVRTGDGRLLGRVYFDVKLVEKPQYELETLEI